MTKEAIEYFESQKKELEYFREMYPSPEDKGYKDTTKEIGLVDMAISALKDNEWIPVNGIEDIPKSGSYWVTREYGFDTLVEKIRWSDVWRCWVDKDDDSVITKESAEIITAYMPYFEPEPYKKGE